MAVENDDPIALPPPPPPRPAARKAAIETALRKFDGIAEPAEKRPTRPWWVSHQRQLGALATAAVIVIVSIPVALTVLRDQPKPMASQSPAPAVVQPKLAPSAPPETSEAQPSQDQAADAEVPPSRLPLQPHSAAPPLALVPEEQKAANEAPALAVAPPAAAPAAPPPPPPPPAKTGQYSQEAGAQDTVVTGSRIARSNLGKPSSAGVMAERSSEPDSSAAAETRFLSRLQVALRADDRSAIVGLVALPLRVNFDGGARTYKDRRSVERDFDRIFTARVRRAILSQKADALFINYQGAMIGDGAVWFGQTCPGASCSPAAPVRITAINP